MHFLALYALMEADFLGVVDEEDNQEGFEMRMLNVLQHRRTVAERYAVHRTARLQGTFQLQDWALHYHKSFFRFIGADIERFQRCAGVPDMILVPQYGYVPGIEATCLMLRRFAFPARWVDLQIMFRRDYGAMSRIFRWMVAHLVHRYERTLHWHEGILNKQKMLEFCLHSLGRGSSIPNIWGYIDGTFVRCCRPKRGKG